MNPHILAIIAVLLTLTVIGGIYKHIVIGGKVVQFDKKTTAESCRLCPIRGDTCYLNEYKPCNMASYKQCTNNFMPPSTCQCKTQRGFELCEKNLQMSEACYMNHYNLKPNMNIDVINSEKYPRVNKHNIPYTPFDRFEHLRAGDDSTIKNRYNKEALPDPIPMEVAAANTITRIPIQTVLSS